jgi:hypothetical protein
LSTQLSLTPNVTRVEAPQPIPTAPVLPVGEHKAAEYWDALCSFTQQWFYEPDMQAVATVLAALAAHYELEADPTWLFVVGPAGSGKTALCIYPCAALANTHVMGDITPRTFLSGYKGQKNASFLTEMGQSGILLFKDFTTFLSKRQDDRAAIASQLREIYDGSFTKSTGMGGGAIPWQGKVTCVAATTPAIERYWALQREFGERFCTVRWQRKDGIQCAEYARRQFGHEIKIRKELASRYAEFFQLKPSFATPAPVPTDAQSTVLSTISEIVALSRTQVARDVSSGSRAIIDVPQAEENTRLSKALSSLARYHASLFRRTVITTADLRIAARVGMDSIPRARQLIICALPKDADKGTMSFDLCQLTGLNASTLNWTVDELEALGVVRVDKLHGGENFHSLTPNICKLWANGFGSPLLLPAC